MLVWKFFKFLKLVHGPNKNLGKVSQFVISLSLQNQILRTKDMPIYFEFWVARMQM